MKYWEVIADKLHGSGWSWGYCSAVTKDGWRWVVDAHKGDGKRYAVQSDELLSAFLELGTDALVKLLIRACRITSSQIREKVGLAS